MSRHRPKAFLLENVKNLTSHDKGRTFRTIVETLEELNYSIYYEVLNGLYYVPQHRQRIFIVGFDKEYFGGRERFSFPIPPDSTPRLGDILEESVDEK